MKTIIRILVSLLGSAITTLGTWYLLFVGNSSGDCLMQGEGDFCYGYLSAFRHTSFEVLFLIILFVLITIGFYRGTKQNYGF